MKRTESISSAQVLKKTQPEEFDLVILGGGTGFLCRFMLHVLPRRVRPDPLFRLPGESTPKTTCTPL
jgi:hypothetical protein